MPKSQRSRSRAKHEAPVAITRALLERWRLPDLHNVDEKDDRGTVLVIGGSRGTPGSVVLAGIGALRAGAGKLQIATSASVASAVAVAVPESLTIYLDETQSGAIDAAGANDLREYVENADVVVIGPGMETGDDTKSVVDAVIAQVDGASIIIDAGAISCFKRGAALPRNVQGKTVMTPHAGEMASLMDTSKEKITDDPAYWASHAAWQLNAVVALKGAQTFVAEPRKKVYEYRGGGIGLATSGSGDTLAGIIAGLLARGAQPIQAAVWGVFAHGESGNILAEKTARVGFLAREIPGEVPGILESI